MGVWQMCSKKNKKSLTPQCAFVKFPPHTEQTTTNKQMRTKTLLFTAAVIASGFTAATAQSVYSVNAVGYVNLNIGVGFTMIANPLNTTNNTIGSLMPTIPDFSTLYKWNEGAQGFDIATYFFGSWDNPSLGFAPGEGAFLQVDTAFTLTFVGEVMQGNLTNAIPANFSMKSSKVPQTGLIGTDLGLTVGDFDTLYKWVPANQGYDIFTYFFGSWSPSEPAIGVGEAFFLQTGAPLSWTRTFSVN